MNRATIIVLAIATVVVGVIMATTIPAHASLIHRVYEYKCGNVIKRHSCWDTVQYRVCYKTDHIIGCTRWRIYAR